MKRTRTFVLWTAAAAAAIIGAVAAYATLGPSDAERFKAVDITGAAWGRGFELTDHQGKKRTLEDFRGKVVLLFFGYTGCPDMCPTTLALLGGAMRELGGDADKVQLFVTVDPKRDTPQLLAQYVPAFHPSFLGLYGDEAVTERTCVNSRATSTPISRTSTAPTLSIIRRKSTSSIRPGASGFSSSRRRRRPSRSRTTCACC
jgi:cytochrome oxidase Cu insertion factor (SCO1/SenC/PrrC family)